MKQKNIVKSLIISALLIISSLSSFAQDNGVLTLNIEGIRNNKGNLMIALGKSPNPMDMEFAALDMAPSDSTGMKFSFEIPESTVYVKVFHAEMELESFIKETQEGKMPKGGFGYIGDIPGPPPAVEIKNGETKEISMKIYYF